MMRRTQQLRHDRPRARAARFVAGLGVAFLGLLVIATGAMADVTTRYPVTTSIGPDGTSGTSFSRVESIAFDQNSDRLLALDKPNEKIHGFDAPALGPSGSPFPLDAPGTGQHTGAISIAVDNTAGATAGRIYYTSNPDFLLHGFTASGTPLGGNFPVEGLTVPCGTTVDASGNIWVGEWGGTILSTRRISKFSPNGNLLDAVPTAEQGQFCRVAIASNGDLFAAQYPSRTWKYSVASGYTEATMIDPDSARGVAVDSSAGIVYVAHETNVFAYDFDGTFLYDFASGIAGSFFEGVTVDEGTDTVYVSDSGNDKVHSFPLAQSYPNATASPNAATNVSYFSADISATVDDNSEVPTRWRLEVSGDSGQSWSTLSSGSTAGDEIGVVVSGTVSGLSLNTEYEFRAVTNKGVNPVTAVPSASDSFTTLDHPDADVAATAATNVTGTSADLGGTIDDNGPLPTNWTFELSDDGGTTWDVVESGQTAGGESGAVVAGTATGLIPNSEYLFRIVTGKGPGSSPVTSNTEFFQTEAVPPVLTDIGAIQVTDVSARFVGTINPRNAPTSYVFEYGTSPALGTSTDPVDVGTGLEDITVSQVISGLNADTTYHFRMVATNAGGITESAIATLHTRADPPPPADPGNCANQALREAQAATYLPDCRAFEMVSPPDKNQGSVAGQGNRGGEGVSGGFSRDGEAVGFCTASLFGEPAGQMSFTCAQYLSRRGPEGWTTKNPLPKFCASDAQTGEAEIFIGPRYVLLAPESFQRFAFSSPEFADCPTAPLVDGAPLDSTNIYRGDLTSDPTEFHVLTPQQSGEIGSSMVWPMGGSDDLSRVVYATFWNQTPDSPPQDEYFKLYDWAEPGHDGCAEPAGCLELVSVAPNGTAFASDSRMPAYNFGVAHVPIPSAVSADGKRIYFQNPALGTTIGAGQCNASSCDIYLREGAETIKVSESECTGPCAVDQGADNFVWASPSGDTALFVSCAQLTDQSAPGTSCDGNRFTSNNLKLYRWDRTQPPGSRLTDLSIDEEPADGAQPQALDIIGASSDEEAGAASNAAPGNTVYFVAGGQILADAPTHDRLKLYRWQWNDGDPGVNYIGPYVSAWPNAIANENSIKTDQILSEDPNISRNDIRVSPDGGYLTVQTPLALDPVADRDSDVDIYRWDEQGGWICVSCQLPGEPSLGHANSYTPHLSYNALYGELGMQVPAHLISDDGQRIFFSTPNALVSEDVNGEVGCTQRSDTGLHSSVNYDCTDIYQWHDGTTSLLSTGTGSRPFMLMGATGDGGSVFFATAQRLVGWDLDDQVDIYVARVEGGFSEPPPAPAVCEGEACRGAGTSSPDTPEAGSSAFQGLGNPAITPAGSCARHVRRARRAGRQAVTLRQRARRASVRRDSARQVRRARQLNSQARRALRRAKRARRAAMRCRASAKRRQLGFEERSRR